jgi:hypothetical protein
MPLHARQTLLAISFVPSLFLPSGTIIEADEVLRCSKRQFGLLDLT